MMQPAWAANAAAVAVVFVIAYVVLRMAGHWLTVRLHAHAGLGAVDRSIGLCFGVVRALVFLGVFYLVFNMATPAELVPTWISHGKLYPLARASARVIGAAAPRALKASSPIGPALERAVTDQGADTAGQIPHADHPNAARSRSENPPRKTPGYDKRSRDDIDALVERSR
jgi:membrane protein required for colicin V production